MTQEEDRFLSRVEGMFVGSLDDSEVDLLNRCVEKGWAIQSYEGGAGFMGLSKVRRALVNSTNTR